MNDNLYSPQADARTQARNDHRRELARVRKAKQRERQGAAVGTSISLPPEVHEAASRLLRISRRGGSAMLRERAYLVGCMMLASAGQSAVAREMATEYATVKTWLASLDGDAD